MEPLVVTPNHRRLDYDSCSTLNVSDSETAHPSIQALFNVPAVSNSIAATAATITATTTINVSSDATVPDINNALSPLPVQSLSLTSLRSSLSLSPLSSPPSQKPLPLSGEKSVSLQNASTSATIAAIVDAHHISPTKATSTIPGTPGTKQQRKRRRLCELERRFKCNYGNCQNVYASENSLNMHQKLKNHQPKPHQSLTIERITTKSYYDSRMKDSFEDHPRVLFAKAASTSLSTSTNTTTASTGGINKGNYNYVGTGSNNSNISPLSSRANFTSSASPISARSSVEYREAICSWPWSPNAQRSGHKRARSNAISYEWVTDYQSPCLPWQTSRLLREAPSLSTTPQPHQSSPTPSPFPSIRLSQPLSLDPYSARPSAFIPIAPANKRARWSPASDIRVGSDNLSKDSRNSQTSPLVENFSRDWAQYVAFYAHADASTMRASELGRNNVYGHRRSANTKRSRDSENNLVIYDCNYDRNNDCDDAHNDYHYNYRSRW